MKDFQNDLKKYHKGHSLGEEEEFGGSSDAWRVENSPDNRLKRNPGRLLLRQGWEQRQVG